MCLHDDAVLLARRALHPDDPWSGHVGLPGGRWEPGDESLLATALREARGGARHRSARARPAARGAGHAHRPRPAGHRRAHRRSSSRRSTSGRELELSAELDVAHWVPLSELVPVTARVAELPDTDVPAYESRCPTAIAWSCGGSRTRSSSACARCPTSDCLVPHGLEQPRAGARPGATGRCGSPAPPAARRAGSRSPARRRRRAPPARSAGSARPSPSRACSRRAGRRRARGRTARGRSAARARGDRRRASRAVARACAGRSRRRARGRRPTTSLATTSAPRSAATSDGSASPQPSSSTRTPVQVERREVRGERAGAGPQLRPVGRVAARIRGDREQLLGLARAQEPHGEISDRHGVLVVGGHRGSRSSTSAVRIRPRCEYACGWLPSARSARGSYCSESRPVGPASSRTWSKSAWASLWRPTSA